MPGLIKLKAVITRIYEQVSNKIVSSGEQNTEALYKAIDEPKQLFINQTDHLK